MRRDGTWGIVASSRVVPGDLVKLSLGSVAPADVDIVEGSVLLDQSTLTGEPEPVELGAGAQTFAGALVQRGEATAQVTQTGPRTKFGNSAELVRTAHVESSQQRVVLRVVRNIAVFNGAVILALVAYAASRGLAWSAIIPLILTAVLAAIPVALPATFTLAAALGAGALGKLGVLPTRLSAVDEAASVDVLCVDKTGTLTKNKLAVDSVEAMSGYDEAHVLTYATLASDQGGQDPVDAAIREMGSQRGMKAPPALDQFIPFDPAKKLSEATVTGPDGQRIRVVKGAFDTVIALSAPSAPGSAAVKELEGRGLRALAVAEGASGSPMTVTGLIGLSDPPRSDSAELISELASMGVRTVMATGDATTTAAIVAHAVGLEGKVCPAGPLPTAVRPEDFAVFAGIFPEGKYDLVKSFQGRPLFPGLLHRLPADREVLSRPQYGSATDTLRPYPHFRWRGNPVLRPGASAPLEVAAQQMDDRGIGQRHRHHLGARSGGDRNARPLRRRRCLGLGRSRALRFPVGLRQGARFPAAGDLLRAVRGTDRAFPLPLWQDR